MRIAVLTCALPERLEMLEECIASVESQSLQPDWHFISIDYTHQGCVPNLNRLAAAAIDAGADWLALLADDDLMLPNHLEVLQRNVEKADIVYSWCEVTGRDWNPNTYFDQIRLLSENYIPSTSLISSNLARNLGYWRTSVEHGWEDWDFWRRALARGAGFRCVPEITWVYRFHGSNLSMAEDALV